MKMNNTGMMTVMDEVAMQPMPMPSVVTPEWISEQLQRFGTGLKMDFAVLVDRIVQQRLAGTESDDPNFMTPEAIAKRWGMHVKTVQRKANRGELPAVEIGGRHLVRRSDVIAYEHSRAAQYRAGAERE